MRGSAVPVPGDPVALSDDAARDLDDSADDLTARPGAWWTLRWVRVLAVYLAARVVTTVILLSFAATEGASAWTAAAPDYFTFANI